MAVLRVCTRGAGLSPGDVKGAAGGEVMLLLPQCCRFPSPCASTLCVCVTGSLPTWNSPRSCCWHVSLLPLARELPRAGGRAAPAKASSTDAGLPAEQRCWQCGLVLLEKGGSLGINSAGKRLVCRDVMCFVSLYVTSFLGALCTNTTAVQSACVPGRGSVKVDLCVSA